MEKKTLDYNGKKLVYRTAGSGPVVMLLHGFGEEGSIWRNQFDIFPNHQLIVPDLPGSGESEAIDDMSMEGLAEAIKSLVESLTPGPSPRGEGSEDSKHFKSIDDSQKNTGHYFQTADTHFWKTAKEYGRINRKNPTKAEDLLWQNLRNNKQGVKVRRQQTIGSYLVDFAATEINLVIEVDGDYHNLEEQQNLDRKRQDELQEKGYYVLRFTNEEVLYQMSEVLQEIRAYISKAKRETVPSEAAPLSERRGAGGEAFTLIGHSMGGYITLAFAEKYPHLLNAFGLFHSTAFADSEEKKQSRRKGIETMKGQGAGTFLKTFVPNLYGPVAKEQKPNLLDEHLATVQKVDGAAHVAYFEAMMRRPDRTEVLKKSEVPVLFVMGKWDAAIPLEDGLKQCHLPQTAYIHLLQNSGHCGMVEEAGEANKILSAFVTTVEKRAYT